jgi:hypothetical protein
MWATVGPPGTSGFCCGGFSTQHAHVRCRDSGTHVRACVRVHTSSASPAIHTAVLQHPLEESCRLLPWRAALYITTSLHAEGGPEKARLGPTQHAHAILSLGRLRWRLLRSLAAHGRVQDCSLTRRCRL